MQTSSAEEHDSAWIGDAVLSLYLREKLLSLPKGKTRTDAFQWFSSNQFLSTFGRPSRVEADIGDAYKNGGLENAFHLCDQKLGDAMNRQLEKKFKPI